MRGEELVRFGSRAVFFFLNLVIGFPRTYVLRQQWMQFMFDYVPENDDRNLSLCAVHFTEDSFQNLHEFNAGFNKKLLLNMKQFRL